MVLTCKSQIAIYIIIKYLFFVFLFTAYILWKLLLCIEPLETYICHGRMLPQPSYIVEVTVLSSLEFSSLLYWFSNVHFIGMYFGLNIFRWFWFEYYYGQGIALDEVNLILTKAGALAFLPRMFYSRAMGIGLQANKSICSYWKSSWDSYHCFLGLCWTFYSSSRVQVWERTAGGTSNCRGDYHEFLLK